MKKEMLIILALLFPLSIQTQTRIKADSVQKAYFDSTLNRQGQWEIVWSDVSKTPRILYGSKIKLDGTKIKDREKMAKKFLQDHKELFQIEEKDLKFKTLLKDDLEHIHFDQMHQNIRVVGGGYSLHVNGNEEVTCANGKIFDIAPLDVSPSIDPSQAARSVKSYLGMNDSMEVLGAELVIYPRDSVFYLTYEMYVSSGNLSGSYRALVDAKTGTVIDAENTACRYTNGLANVYKIDPRTPYEQVTLNRLVGNGYVDGQFAKVIDWAGAGAYSETHDFRYDPSDRRFDQANVYYHIDIFQNDFLTPLGFTPAYGEYPIPLEARVHTNVDGAGYDHRNTDNEEQRWVYFGDGGPIHNTLSRKNDVIYHEYAHLVTHQYKLPHTYPGESSSLSEGFSDYFAAAFTGYGNLGEWVLKGVSYARTLTLPAGSFNYIERPDQPGIGDDGPYSLGMVWASALWDLRKDPAMTVNHTDRLVMKAIQHSGATIDELAKAKDLLFAANTQLISNGYPDKRDVIQNTMAGRKIGTGVKMNGPSTVYIGNSYSWTASPINEGSNPLYQWYTRPNSTSSWQPVSPGGTTPTLTRSITGGTELQIKCELTNQNTGVMGYITKTVSILPLTVTISGPSCFAKFSGSHTWYAQPSGGTGTYSYQWTSSNESGVLGTGTSLTKPYGPGFWLYLTVTSGTQTASTSLGVSECSGGGGGLEKRNGEQSVIPDQFELSQNYPNPFNPSTTISFGIPEPSNVTLIVYNIQGQEVRTVFGSFLEAGYYDATWDGKDDAGSQVSSGIYIYRLQAGNYVQSKKMTFVK